MDIVCGGSEPTAWCFQNASLWGGCRLVLLTLVVSHSCLTCRRRCLMAIMRWLACAGSWLAGPAQNLECSQSYRQQSGHRTVAGPACFRSSLHQPIHSCEIIAGSSCRAVLPFDRHACKPFNEVLFQHLIHILSHHPRLVFRVEIMMVLVV